MGSRGTGVVVVTPTFTRVSSVTGTGVKGEDVVVTVVTVSDVPLVLGVWVVTGRGQLFVREMVRR